MEEREREKKNEYESAKDGAQVRGRQNERNVCEKETDRRKGTEPEGVIDISQGTTKREKVREKWSEECKRVLESGLKRN